MTEKTLYLDGMEVNETTKRMIDRLNAIFRKYRMMYVAKVGRDVDEQVCVHEMKIGGVAGDEVAGIHEGRERIVQRSITGTVWSSASRYRVYVVKDDGEPYGTYDADFSMALTPANAMGDLVKALLLPELDEMA